MDYFVSVGSACIYPSLGLQVKKSIYVGASVFTAECITINDALDIALSHKDCNFLIFSDSLSALESLKSINLNIKTNSYIFDIKKVLIVPHKKFK